MITPTWTPPAPVALFTYNRLACLKLAVESLRRCELAGETELHIFSDAPRRAEDVEAVRAVREYLKRIEGFKVLRVVERPENYYIERNIMSGVEEMFEKHERLIIMEDDALVGRKFLSFMNKALGFYAPVKEVMHVSPWTFIEMPEGRRTPIIWRYMECTGAWATWRDRWRSFKYLTKREALALLSPEDVDSIQMGGALKCLKNLDLNPIPWDICWQIAIRKAGGVTVNAPWPIVENTGLYNGEHFGTGNILHLSPFETEIIDDDDVAFSSDLAVDAAAEAKIKEFFARGESGILHRALFKLRLLAKKIRWTLLGKRRGGPVKC